MKVKNKAESLTSLNMHRKVFESSTHFKMNAEYKLNNVDCVWQLIGYATLNFHNKVMPQTTPVRQK